MGQYKLTNSNVAIEISTNKTRRQNVKTLKRTKTAPSFSYSLLSFFYDDSKHITQYIIQRDLHISMTPRLQEGGFCIKNQQSIADNHRHTNLHPKYLKVS